MKITNYVVCISARDVADPSTSVRTMLCELKYPQGYATTLQVPCNIHLVDHAINTIQLNFGALL